MLKRVRRTLVLFFAAATLALPASADSATPRQLAEILNATLIQTMQQAKDLGYQGRYNKLSPVLQQVFHFRIMTQVVTNPYWKDFSDSQKDEVTDAFTQMSIATFANRFDGYNGESFVIEGEQTIPDKKLAIVRCRLVKPGKSDTYISYTAKELSSGWRILDVNLESRISEISTRKSEYGSILKNEGYDPLLSTIRTKVAELAAEG